MSRLPDILRRYPWSAAVGAALLLFLAITAGARWNALHTVQESPDRRREILVDEALATIEARFARIRDGVRQSARRLASDSVIVHGLKTWETSSTRSTDLVNRVLEWPRDERTTVEVYSPLPRTIVWSGRRMPLGEAPNTDSFLQRPQMDIVVDRGVRWALVVWWPVRLDEQVLGAVRVARTIRYDPPVKNRYIQGFSLQEEWEQATGESLRLSWAGPSSVPPHSRVLYGLGERPLGVVTVTPPSNPRLEERTADAYNDVLAVWGTLLLGWAVWILALWYHAIAGRTGVRRHAGARRAILGRFGWGAVLWIAGRYLLLAMDVPSRWIGPGTVGASLFDPTHFASTFGGGLFQSIGDLFLTGLWVVLFAAGLLHVALRFRFRADSLGALFSDLRLHAPGRPSSVGFLTSLVGVAVISLGGILSVSYVVRRAILDSTLDFFSRTGLLPEPLVFIVLSSLFLLVAAVLVAGVACVWIGLRLGLRYHPLWPYRLASVSVVVVFAVGIALPYLWPGIHTLGPLPYSMGMLGVIAGAAVYGMVARRGGVEVVTIRGLLLFLFVITLLLYPLLYAGMDAQRRERMEEAARTFEEGYDPRVLYSLRQLLRGADQELEPLLTNASSERSSTVDSIATRLVRRSLLASLTTYDLSLSVLDDDGVVHRRYTSTGPEDAALGPRRVERAVFDKLRRVYTRQLSPGPVIDRMAEDRVQVRGGERYQYAGLLQVEEGAPTRRWVLIRAEPRSLLPGTGPGVPSVLLPDGSFSDLYAELSLAEFQDQTLVRSFGQSFGRTRLSSAYETALKDESHLWRSEVVRGRKYLTYYSRPEDDQETTIAVRIPSVLTFDHLYYVLRLTVAGLGIVIPIYLFGLYGRFRFGLVPARRVRFRNKVLNAFLTVGIVSMVAVGVVGVQVVTGEDERVVERRLRDHLTRVEETLALEANPGEPLWKVAGRMDVDSLAARVGLDLRLYDDGHLIGTSRPRLVRDGLVDERLPGDVYHALHDESIRFRAAPAAIGSFKYMVGYQALVDASGQPRLVVGVPTLAQQEQAAEEQARTLAYLLGALLVLVVVVMLTAVVLANALAQPIARLRAGLEAVGEGRFAEALPVETRDEIGDLTRTFNEMRAQLAESRRKLAQKEREVAWREMARQVAHEIKNPLTPMKLSIQHLRRAFERERAAGDEASRFAEMFDRVTSTLIEQIESLVRIADEFSTFARLPTRVLETIDLNEVVQEAVKLIEGEVQADVLELDLHSEPLVVEADREELRRTYINLLKNAVQAIPDEREGRVRVMTELVEADGVKMVRSQVEDNGEGIPQEARDKIFEPNFSTKTSGTGLGLAIVKKSVDDLGGSIGYETSEGAGTTFWIQLPLATEET